MGYMMHHAIVVTSWKPEAVEAAHAMATQLDMKPSPIVSSGTNGYRSFLVPPDGSKEGWHQSDVGDACRAQLVAWMMTAGDDGLWLDWIEVCFGGDEPGANTRIISATPEWVES